MSHEAMKSEEWSGDGRRHQSLAKALKSGAGYECWSAAGKRRLTAIHGFAEPSECPRSDLPARIFSAGLL
jgi:hypothetical protein